ncbi:hypothetical protein HJ01_03512 [Flavobacterium frigoris PS1]|uniref:Uncharacterized protein n=1 Tax=Flavobacterium frigoris (strain PS1) TaxID=1086011 RepID=H7FWG5_FLAFP|nr:hypothetical protein HJ01_03512 [Flavobacterium frigoris PS1]
MVTEATTARAAELLNSTAIATETSNRNAADLLKANIASPTFTGTPTLPTGTVAITQTSGNNSSAIATTAFVSSAVNTATTGNFVDLNTDQSVGGTKTFSRNIKLFAQSYSNTATMNIGFAPGGENYSGISMGVDALKTYQYGTNDIAIGNGALYKDLRGGDNIAIGYRALYNSGGSVNNDWGNRNVAIGSNSGTNIMDGDNNTLIGYQSNTSVDGISNSTAIGANAIVITSNTIQLGDTNVTNVNTSGAITAASYIKSGGTAIQYLMADGSVSVGATPVREVADEFSAIASQTAFILAQIPSVNSKVKMYVNGIRISNTAYSVTGPTLTYIPANNGSYSLSISDRIQFDYFY